MDRGTSHIRAMQKKQQSAAAAASLLNRRLLMAKPHVHSRRLVRPLSWFVAWLALGALARC